MLNSVTKCLEQNSANQVSVVERNQISAILIELRMHLSKIYFGIIRFAHSFVDVFVHFWKDGAVGGQTL